MKRLIIEARAWAEAAVDLVFPPNCVGCGTVPDTRAVPLCLKCAEEIPRVGPLACSRCCQPYAGVADSDFVCANCGNVHYYFEAFATVYLAKGSVREAVHDFKYRELIGLVPLLTGWMLDALEDPRLVGRVFDRIVPVPLYARKMRERGYNQALLLAQSLAEATRIPCCEHLLRIRDTPTQTLLDRHARIENLRDAFILHKNRGVKDLNLLLVDDVFTTGATLNECSRVLCEAGAASVCVVTVARG